MTEFLILVAALCTAVAAVNVEFANLDVRAAQERVLAKKSSKLY